MRSYLFVISICDTGYETYPCYCRDIENNLEIKFVFGEVKSNIIPPTKDGGL